MKIIYIVMFVLASIFSARNARASEAEELAQIRAQNRVIDAARSEREFQNSMLAKLRKNAVIFIKSGGYHLQGPLFTNFEVTQGRGEGDINRTGYFVLTNGYRCESYNHGDMYEAVTCSKLGARDIERVFVSHYME
jgi:hypothetical protein